MPTARHSRNKSTHSKPQLAVLLESFASIASIKHSNVFSNNAFLNARCDGIKSNLERDQSRGGLSIFSDFRRQLEVFCWLSGKLKFIAPTDLSLRSNKSDPLFGSAKLAGELIRYARADYRS